MKILTVQHPTQDLEVEAVHIVTAQTMHELRASDWVDEQMSVLTYPTGLPIGFLAEDPPRALGDRVLVGDTVLKGPAGDFEVVRGAD